MKALKYYRKSPTLLMAILGLVICLFGVAENAYAQRCKLGAREVGRQNTLDYILEILKEETVTCDDGRQYTFSQDERNKAVIALISNKRTGGIAFIPTPATEAKLVDAGANETLINLINQIWKRNPDPLAFTIRLGDDARMSAKYDEAVVNYSKAVELDPGNESVYYNRGLSYKGLALQYRERGNNFRREKNEEEAVKNFDEANKYYDLAIEDFTKAISIDRTIPTRYYNRGLSYYEKPTNNDTEKSRVNGLKAIEDFTQAILYDPQYKDAYKWRANTYRFKLGGKDDREKAIADYQECMKLGGCQDDPSIRNYIAASKPS